MSNDTNEVILEKTQRELLEKQFQFKHVTVAEHPDSVWIQLVGCGELDNHVWTIKDANIDDEGILSFEVETINLPDVPEELKEYAASLLMKSLVEMLEERGVK